MEVLPGQRSHLTQVSVDTASLKHLVDQECERSKLSGKLRA